MPLSHYFRIEWYPEGITAISTETKLHSSWLLCSEQW